ncbi:MAG: hypothetical protein ACP5LN_07365 [Thermoproteota archaeon]
METIVVIADGTPDDIVFSIVRYHMNGRKVVGVVKPHERTGLSAVYEVPTCLKMKICNVLLLIDQEEMNLENIFFELSKRLKKCGIEIKKEDKSIERRIGVYEGIHGQKRFNLIVVVNGLEEIKTKRHSIEDHLIKVAKTVNLGNLEEFNNSKDAWESLKEDDRLRIYEFLKITRK